MALAGSRKAILGDAVVRTAVTGSATVDISFFPSNSDFNRALKLSRGRLRNSAATLTKGSISGSVFPGLLSDRPSIVSMLRFSSSTFLLSFFPGSFFPGPRERLGIGTLHARPQTAERAELQLLHRAFSFANLPRHFFNTFLFYKPQHNHPFLFRGKRLNQAKQRSPALHVFNFSRTDLRRFEGAGVGALPF